MDNKSVHNSAADVVDRDSIDTEVENGEGPVEESDCVEDQPSSDYGAALEHEKAKLEAISRAQVSNSCSLLFVFLDYFICLLL